MLRVLLLAILPLLTGCGAGVIGGIFASNRRSGAAAVRTITIDDPYTSIYGQEGQVRTVTLTGYEVPATGRLRVILRVLGLPDRSDPGNLKPDFDLEQQNAVRGEVGGNLTRLFFTISTAALPRRMVDEGRDLTAADLPALLIVRVDDADVAPPIPFVIYKQPRATLVLSRQGSTEELLSAAGGTQLTCRLRGHVSNAAGLWVVFALPDPARGEGVITQELRNITVEPVPGTDEVLVKVVTPPNPFPCRLLASVQDQVAGLSTPLDPIYYRPDIGFVVPPTASTDGGTRTLVVGTGLLPLRFPEPGKPGELDYDSIELFVEKGGRRVQVPPGLIQRQPASSTRLDFELPAAPDGRTGPADLILTVDLGSARLATRAEDLFAYGDNEPNFGPRGVALPTRPTHVALGDIEGDGGGLDAVACWGTQPIVQLMVASDNGMLRRFGGPLIAGSTFEALERSPQRLVVTDLDRSGSRDVLVFNLGNGVTANHTMLLGQPPPAAPLRLASAKVAAAASAATCVRGDLDGNGSIDVVLLPPGSSGMPPEVCLSFGDPVAGPRFVVNPLTQVGEVFDVMELADLDRDGALDLALARGGQDVALQTLYGRGDGSFAVGQTLALTRQIPNYLEDPLSPAVGLHACGDHRLRGLALVLSGVHTAATPATVAVLDYAGGRRHLLPSPTRTINYDVDDSFKRSLLADLDADGVDELVVASQKSTTLAAVRVFAWASVLGEPAFVELRGSADLGGEPMYAVGELGFGSAGRRLDGSDRPAVFLAHKYVYSPEDHITTLLVDRQAGGPRLLAPDASQSLPYMVEGVALGRFRGALTTPGALDVVAASAGSGGGALRGLQFFANDGAGTLQAAARVPLSLLPTTVVALPLTGGDAALGLDRDRVLRVVRPALPPPYDVQSLALDPYLPAALRAAELLGDSRLAVADVDGDGAADVVALLLFQLGSAPVEELGQLLVLFGTGQSAVESLPFVVPDPAVVRPATAHAQARDLVVEEFAVNARPNRLLEVAVAVGGTANHVRFYRVDRPNEPAAVRSLRRSFLSAAEPVLLAGEGPERLATADVNGDRVVDLAVASSIDRRLRLFTSTARAGDEVDIASFRQIPVGVLSLPEETPLQVFLRDVNGDMVPDLLVSCFDTFPEATTTVQYHLGTGTGQFSAAVEIPPIRTGDLRWDTAQGAVARRVRLRLAVGEMNGDGAVDIVSGCPTFGAGDRNLLQLFGGAR